MTREKTFQRALTFMKRKHAGQFRAGRVPTWHHLVRVSQVLDFALQQTREGSAQERSIISLAALGHDLLEDTNATEEEVRVLFGDRGLALIAGMTNRWGDKNALPYVKQVARAGEAVRIIKLADLYDNISNVTYCFKILGRKWVVSYFLPIVEPMLRAVKETKFSKYKKSAGLLIFTAEAALDLLKKEL